MIKKKIVMLGAFAVGKTSLVQQFVHSIFSEKYLTSIGVKIDQKELMVNGQEMTMMLWDLYGEDGFMKMKPSYMIGSSGYFLVADGTRSETIETAIELQRMAAATTNNAPFILLINKSDLTESWEIAPETLLKLQQKGWTVMLTSAKQNLMVNDAFQKLGQMMLEKNNG